MLFVDSIEKLGECVWYASKNDDVCQRSDCGRFSHIFLRHIYGQSGDEPRKPYFRNISCRGGCFSCYSGFSGAGVPDFSGSLSTLLNLQKVTVKSGELPKL